jgi:hypothetical protein
MVKRAPAKRRPRKAKPGTKGLAPSETILERLDEQAADAAAVVEKVGGHLAASYKEPLGGHPSATKSNQSPILKLLLSRLDELVARASKKIG